MEKEKSSESINDIIKISEFSKSTFDHFIPLFVRQALASSGEVFVSKEGGSLSLLQNLFR